jgi:enediyne biosynthesis protein E4
MRFRWIGCTALAAISLAGCGSDEPPRRLAFEDRSSDIPSVDVYGDYGAFWGDFNNDSYLDLVYMGHGQGPLLLAQTEDHDFENVTSGSGIRNSNWQYVKQRDRHGASCADFDNDGNLDFFISHGAKRGETLGIKYDELLKGNGDFTFTDITQLAGTMNQFGRGRSSVWFDYNNDGWIDLYALNLDSKNVMYRNNSDGTFTDVTAEANLGFPATRAAPADIDQDGDIDLLVTWPLNLYLNDGNGHFVMLKQPEFAPKGLIAYGIAWGDADNDGDLDIFASARNKENVLFINDDGHFRVQASDAWKAEAKTISAGVSWGDMDNDGLTDVVNVRSDGYFVYLNEGNLSFSPVKLDAPAPAMTKESINGDAALADFNQDGLLDIASDDQNGYMLLQNKSAPVNKWLELKFEGTKNNRLGMGNKVWVSSGDKLIAFREHTGSGGDLRSGSCGPLHIGVGQNQKVDIRVQWLNGFESILHDVPVNQVLALSDSEPAQ